jgi:hypothetical protein
VVTGVFDQADGQTKLYVNGKLEATTAVAAGWNASSGFEVGAVLDTQNLFKGSVDQVQTWGTALTDDQVAALAGLTYYDSVAHTSAVASGGVALGADPNAAGTPTGCAAQLDHTWTGQVTAPHPANLRTDGSFTLEGWVKHTWTAADIAALGAVDPSSRSMIGMTDSQQSPVILGYQPWQDPSGNTHGKWSVILTSSAPDADNSSFEWSDADAANNTWTHLAATYDASTKTMALYINGVLQHGNYLTPTGNGNGIIARHGSGDLLLGSSVWAGQHTNFVYGGIAGIRVYSGIRSDISVRADKKADDPGALFGVSH